MQAKENGHSPQGNGSRPEPEIDTFAGADARPDGFFIVGIGASAGGVEALQTFFRNVPVDSGMAYVVILHLSPNYDSHLAEVLQSVTSNPVTRVTDTVPVVPNNVYVVSPDQHLTMAGDSIAVSSNTLTEDRRAPVDIFFRTLAQSHGPRAIAVVLSGTGANGSMGIKRIKEMGGAAFVQNPREAEFADMPRNSIATELIDEVLPVAAIPAKLISYREGVDSRAIPLNADEWSDDLQQAFRAVFTQLRVRTGHDFANYKRPTMLRRIERRLNVRGLPDLPSYAEYVRQNPEETHALLKDLLISVTNFFRDKAAFNHVETAVIPAIFEGKTSADHVRIWVTACATGEEAYSLAMLCAERALGVPDSPKVQIFATDIDVDAIATAREGLYTINDAADVSRERLQRFFIKEGTQYRVRREIREMMMFANHNIIKDPPFSHLDMVTCRNLMIYLNPQAKERVLETIHFSLDPGGYLFLGSAEAVEGASDLYAQVSREHHIYQARLTGQRSYPIPETVPNFNIQQRPADSPKSERQPLSRMTYGELHHQLIEQYAPPSVIVNEEYDVVHLSERAGRYMQVVGGEPTSSILKMVKPEFRLELRTALYQASQRKTYVDALGIQIKNGDETETIDLHVRPVLASGDTARGFILIIFEPVSRQADPDRKPIVITDEPIARQLEDELVRQKQQLRVSSEQYELQTEELKASNEELQAMNEELRSALEELETSKEELQSMNEELMTVNQELKVNVEETTISRNNLQNLMNSTNIGTIFLDRGFRVQLYTQAACDIVNLIPADIGRPISDITHRLDYDGLIDDATFVLDKLQTVERELTAEGNRDYLVRLLPYRTDDDRINGVVITLIDITERKRALGILEEQTDELTRFNEAMVGREERMVELKKEINDLSERLQEPKRYLTEFDG